MNKRTLILLLLLILLTGFALRTFQLTNIPPGLTHDEANHGREALGILDGVLLFYFPLNYGSEPLYSYTAALSMWLFGEGLFALRLVNVIFGLATIIMTYLWAARAFDRKTAVLTAALIAISFWPLASSREALRVGMLPFFTTAAVYFFWRILETAGISSCRDAETQRNLRKKSAPSANKSAFPIWQTIAFGISITFTLHIYLASRVAWLMFPLFLLYLFLIHRPIFKQSWKPVVTGLLLAGLLVIPMFVYLRLHPEALTRLDMLDGPLQALTSGNIRPLFKNVSEALLAFIWPGYGDQFLAYNIPGRPVLDGITAVFFIIGLGTSIWHWRQPASAFLLLWFGVGIIPSLITGATANTTRNMAALPAVYLLPAVGFWAIATWLMARFDWLKRPFVMGTAVLWLLFIGWTTYQDYFVRWANLPDVRGAYQVNLINALTHIAQTDPNTPLVISTVYPGPVHDASIALVIQPASQQSQRWIDARYALIWPAGSTAQAIIPASTPPNPLFNQWLTPLETHSLRPTDHDPSYTLNQLQPPELDTLASLANFGNAIELIDAYWTNPATLPGETTNMVTMWRVLDPAQIGPSHPPANTPDTAFFTQILTPDGGVLSQRDALDAPSWNWHTGDILIQIHPLTIPAESQPGEYRTIIGIYDRPTLERVPTIDENGNSADSFFNAPPLIINH
ncbi:MAG: glycosyltransferase family 39 protein [Anaerolineae bacterium]|nr:glycosyltransferase family 39 protein [Anaerolineae bacterium]